MLGSSYRLRRGNGLDRALLVKFMQRTYRELYPAESFAHLAQTVERYFSGETPLWWVEQEPAAADSNSPSSSPMPIGCVWIGTAIDQVTGQRHPHVFLLYVSPDHRRQGIGSALMQQVETWAKERGNHQIGLQVFQQNLPARHLYEKLGYHPQALWLVKSIDSEN